MRPNGKNFGSSATTTNARREGKDKENVPFNPPPPSTSPPPPPPPPPPPATYRGRFDTTRYRGRGDRSRSQSPAAHQRKDFTRYRSPQANNSHSAENPGGSTTATKGNTTAAARNRHLGWGLLSAEAINEPTPTLLNHQVTPVIHPQPGVNPPVGLEPTSRLLETFYPQIVCPKPIKGWGLPPPPVWVVFPPKE